MIVEMRLKMWMVRFRFTRIGIAVDVSPGTNEERGIYAIDTIIRAEENTAHPDLWTGIR